MNGLCVRVCVCSCVHEYVCHMNMCVHEREYVCPWECVHGCVFMSVFCVFVGVSGGHWALMLI